MTALLAARGIRKSFGGVEVLHGVDLDAIPGSILALLGENGAGKSTLVRILAGDYVPDAGKIQVGDQSFARLTLPSAQAAGIRMIHQEFPDAPTLSVAENVLLGRLPSHLGVVNWRAVRTRAAAVFKDMGIAMDPDRLVGSLSVGERQVVEIAKALSERPARSSSTSQPGPCRRRRSTDYSSASAAYVTRVPP